MYVQTFQAKLTIDKLLSNRQVVEALFSMHAFIFPLNSCMQPIDNALALFTEGSSMRKQYIQLDHVYSLEFLPDTAEIIRLCTVATVFKC